MKRSGVHCQTLWRETGDKKLAYAAVATIHSETP